MTHFSEFELRRWQDAGPGEDRERIVAHLAECPECASRYAAGIKNANFTPEPVNDIGKYVAAGYAVHAGRRWLMPLAAAAIVVFAVAIPLLMRRSEPDHELRLRGSSVQTLAPSGALDLHEPQFKWASGLAASRFRLEVGRDERVLAVTETTETHVAVPPQMLSRMRPGVQYWWRVTALDERGQPVAASQRAAFFLPPR